MIAWRVAWVVAPGDPGERSVSRADLQRARAQRLRPDRSARGPRCARRGPAAANAEWQRRDETYPATRRASMVPAAGGWSLLLDVAALELDSVDVSDRLLEQKVAATSMRGWGGEIADRHVRFVFSNEPVQRLAPRDASSRGTRGGPQGRPDEVASQRSSTRTSGAGTRAGVLFAPAHSGYSEEDVAQVVGWRWLHRGMEAVDLTAPSLQHAELVALRIRKHRPGHRSLPDVDATEHLLEGIGRPRPADRRAGSPGAAGSWTPSPPVLGRINPGSRCAEGRISNSAAESFSTTQPRASLPSSKRNWIT